MRVHLIGAGKMGLPMGKHLAAAGHQVTVDDLQEERLKAAVSLRLAVAKGPVGIKAAELVLSSLPNDDALWHVAQEVCSHAQPGTVYIDTSTVSPGMSSRVAELLHKQHVVYLRATV